MYNASDAINEYRRMTALPHQNNLKELQAPKFEYFETQNEKTKATRRGGRFKLGAKLTDATFELWSSKLNMGNVSWTTGKMQYLTKKGAKFGLIVMILKWLEGYDPCGLVSAFDAKLDVEFENGGDEAMNEGDGGEAGEIKGARSLRIPICRFREQGPICVAREMR